MTKIKKLPRNKITDYLISLRKEYQVFVPCRLDNLSILLPYTGGEELFWEGFPVLSPKEVLFPSSEALFSYSYFKDSGGKENKEAANFPRTEVRMKAEVKKEKTLVFGIHCCDVKGFFTFDSVFSGKAYQDPYYKMRRDNTILAAISCDRPANTCFCTSVGGGPADSKGADLLFTSVDDYYLIEAVTSRGKALLSSSVFKEASEKDIRRATEAKKKSYPKVKKIFSTQGLAEKLMALFNGSYDDYWKKTSASCLNCGVCTYLCPTCYCFNITDEEDTFFGERIRSWDSCMFPLFTLESSGYNPRSQKFQRFRNRFNHKFSYFVTRYGEISCTGCGRCIRHCPVNIDIREVLKGVQELKV